MTARSLQRFPIQLGNGAAAEAQPEFPRDERAMDWYLEHPDGRRESVTLGPGEYAINPPGVWHTADIAGEATGVFITAGAGTQHRPR